MASFEGVLANIPGYGGYLAKDQLNRRNTLSDLQQVQGVQGLLAQVQAQQRAQQVQGVLSDPSIPAEQKRMALVGLMRDPTQAANAMHQMETEKANADFRRAQTETQGRLLEAERRRTAQDARVQGASDQLSSLLSPQVSERDGAQRIPFVGTEAQLIEQMKKAPGVYSLVNPAQVRGLQAIIDPKEMAKGLLSTGKQDAPYTLGPGAMRLDANGNVIAQAPFAPRVEPTQQIVQTPSGPAILPRGATSVTPLTDSGGRALDSNKPPAGYRFKADGSLEPIPGGPADNKIQGQENKDAAAYQSGVSDLDRLAMEANKVLNHPGLPGITGIRGAIPNIPGTDAANAQALLGTLKSQVGFGVLQTMRNNSKTGGALGSVSDAEGKRLEANLASLEKAQSFEQFQDSLKQIIDFTENAKGRLRGAYNMRGASKNGGATGDFGGNAATNILNQADAILKGR